MSNYLVVFAGHEGIDNVHICVPFDIERPNNADDIELIKKYIVNEYGYKDYEIFPLDITNKVIL